MKYAYLIIANRNPKQVQKLITLLDDSRNDIYLLIDKKSIDFPHNFEVNYSQLNYVKPINIYWGGYSQIEAELELFQAAFPEHYWYYHLLSGQDLPLVNQDKIHDFFDSNLNKEFIKYKSITKYNFYYLNMRLKPHIFRKKLLSKNRFIQRILKIQRLILTMFPNIYVPSFNIRYASNWVSIDNNLIRLIINNKNWIYEKFHRGICVDELFIPTLITYHMKFLNKIYSFDLDGNLRFMKFNHDHPHVWNYSDINTLKNAKNNGYLFSRKFDDTIDNKIINRIFDDVMNS